MTVLTLEQCRNLSEWGFDVKTDSHWWWNGHTDGFGKDDESRYAVFGKGQRMPGGKRKYACPTLDELIEWLGDDFHSLSMHLFTDPDTGVVSRMWSAHCLVTPFLREQGVQGQYYVQPFVGSPSFGAYLIAKALHVTK